MIEDGPDVRLDRTGAGDALCGVIAAALAGGDSLETAATRGVWVASLSVQHPGAVASIPWLG